MHTCQTEKINITVQRLPRHWSFMFVHLWGEMKCVVWRKYENENKYVNFHNLAQTSLAYRKIPSGVILREMIHFKCLNYPNWMENWCHFNEVKGHWSFFFFDASRLKSLTNIFEVIQWSPAVTYEFDYKNLEKCMYNQMTFCNISYIFKRVPSYKSIMDII